MKAICIDRFVENYNDIKVTEVTRPNPKNGEILIQIAAAGVNFVDLLYCRGKHQNNRSLVRPPFILGLEFAGTVVSSPESSKFSPGDRVFGGSLGCYAEFITVSEDILQCIPPEWDFVSAAGLGATAPVSYGALIDRGELKKGETVLIHAAAGGLGLIAVQIAKAAGARVIATAGSDEKIGVARRFGADECVNYTTHPEWWENVLKMTEGDGVDVVYDSVGLVGNSLKCLKWKGRILIIGFAGREGNIESVAMNRVLLKQAKLIGYRFGMTERMGPGETANTWKALSSMLSKGLLKPTVYDHEYRGLESVSHALKDLGERKVWGKAVVRIKVGGQSSRL
ncbi:zeta-crystallin [Calycina marina]|uniref:Zeta-crystallin n=1 Tax=Calycina marina TaxID=1763456 RepID=A0A9P7Z215_9HELO|nr:zeta-crystallin [Calycina marina]